ncbi:hypothetical protein [Streptomyces sp. NPDC001792]|uniref:hypothetical protein n=1 Tax=unclassified Streptomyces TaxID=2593676 RepID=UPI00331AE3A5
MSPRPRPKLMLQWFTMPVLCAVTLVVTHKLRTGHWYVPYIPVVALFSIAAFGFWYNSDPERVLRAKTRKTEREAQLRREIEEARNLPN